MWKVYKELIPLAADKTSHVGNRLFEHLSTTKDETDYLWYLVTYDELLQTAYSIPYFSSVFNSLFSPVLTI
jgi:hypothetical protein